MVQQTNPNEIKADAMIEAASAPTALEVQMDSSKAIARIASISQVVDGCCKVSIQRTNASDWVKMGDKYYLQASGAQKIRPVWGIYFRDRQVTREDYGDGKYGYIVTGKVGSKVLDQLYGEVEIEIDGGRSSSDAFFTGRDGNKIPDPMDIRKAALANWEARAVTALLGLKNMTAEDLKRNGIQVASVAGVSYQSGAEGGGQSGVLVSEAQLKRLYAICKENRVSEETLKAYIKKAHNLDSRTQIPRSIYESICNAVQSGAINEMLTIDMEKGA